MTARDVCDSRLRASFCPEGALQNLLKKLRSGHGIAT